MKKSRDGKVVTIDGVKYIFDSEQDADSFINCVTSDVSIEGCLDEHNGKKLTRPSPPKF